MTHKPTHPGKSAACLSNWRLWQAATQGEATLPSTDRAHLTSCASCSMRLHEEAQEASAYAHRELPARLMQVSATAKSARRGRSWWVPVLAVGVACAAGLVLLAEPERPANEERLKGQGEVRLSVKRGGAMLAHDVALAKVPALQEGDQLRIRVVTPLPWLVFWSQEAKAWVELYRGTVPPGGWLPLGLRYDPASHTPLRVLSCPQPAATVHATSLPKGCSRLDFSL